MLVDCGHLRAMRLLPFAAAAKKNRLMPEARAALP